MTRGTFTADEHTVPVMMERLRDCRRVSRFDPTRGDDEEFARLCKTFIEVLHNRPAWALEEAFRAHIEKNGFFPTPAEINMRVLGIMEWERKYRAAPPADRQPSQPVRDEKTVEERAEAERILRNAGFTPEARDAIRKAPTALTFAAAREHAGHAARHWTEGLADGHPWWAQLEAVRDANPLIAAARRDREKGIGATGAAE